MEPLPQRGLGVPFKPSFYGGYLREERDTRSYSHSSNSVSSADSSTSPFSCNFDFKFQFDPEFHILLSIVSWNLISSFHSLSALPRFSLFASEPEVLVSAYV